jgi:hypothetical protein
MGTPQVIFAVERCGGATGSDMTGSHVTRSDVSHVLCPKYGMRNRKLRHIRPIVAF